MYISSYRIDHLLPEISERSIVRNNDLQGMELIKLMSTYNMTIFESLNI